MNHPTQEEWVSYVYGEASAGERANLAAHLRACPDCQANVGGWQRALQTLDEWHIRPRKAARPGNRPLAWLLWPQLTWATAALLLIAGFGVGRSSLATAQAQKVRAALEPRVRQELRQEFAQLLHGEITQATAQARTVAGAETRKLLADYARALETKHQDDTQALYTALGKLDALRMTDFILLKKEIDTLAVNADAGLRSTERQMIQWADYRPSADLP